MDFDEIGLLQEDALEYIAGYMIRKLNLKEDQCHENTFSWVHQLSKGHLKKPSSAFLSKIKRLEVIFSKITEENNTENLNMKKTVENITTVQNLHKQLVIHSRSVDLPEHVRRFFYKCRIHFRVRNLNKRLKIQNAKQRLIGNKKLLKINL